ncbi:MAG: hypothetical protein ABI315_13425 [Bacteroidia bacterium]
MLKFSAFSFILLLLCTAVGTTSSCNKDKTCHGKVHVKDTAGVAVTYADVKLDAKPVQGQVAYDGVTDGNGDVSFEVKLPGIFDVTVTKKSLPGRIGTGILRLDEPGKKDNITIIFK